MDMRVGNYLVAGAKDGGLPPEFYAEKLCQMILHVSDDAPEEIRMQAYAFRDRLKGAVYKVIVEAIEADRRTLKQRLM